MTSHRSYKLLKQQAPEMFTKCRGKLEIKGKGEMLVFWVGDDPIHTRKHLPRRSVEFSMDGIGDNTSVRSLFESDAGSNNEKDLVDEKRMEQNGMFHC